MRFIALQNFYDKINIKTMGMTAHSQRGIDVINALTKQ